MSVLKSKRSESDFKVISMAMDIRKELTTYVIRDFAIDGRLDYMEEWLLNDTRTAVLQYARNAAASIEMANSIYISSKEEYTERRKYQNRAIGYYKSLIQELRYIVAAMPTKINLNKYMRSIELIDKEIGLIRQWKRSDNKILKKLG